jgi:hypothetical protein
MLDPQTIQTVVLLAAAVFILVFILCLFWGLILLAKIRKQAVGINKRLDELLARTSSGRGETKDTGMSL